PLAAQAPEFLRTHPVTVSRIAETRERALRLEAREPTDAMGYTLTRARARVLSSRTPEQALAYFRGEQESGAADLGTEYGIALAQLGLGRHAEALDAFGALMAAHPEIIHFHTGLASARQAAGDAAGAVELLDRAMA